MNALLATFVLISILPWLSCASPALTERRGCRAGYSLNPISDLCELCPTGTFTDSYNWENQCQSCSVCTGGRQMVAACTASSNTVCKCADDYYEHQDGCSPKPRTTQSGIADLSSILQGLGEQMGAEIQKGHSKIDNLSETVEHLRETVASGVFADKRMQEKINTIKAVGIVTCVILCVIIFAMAVFIIQRRCVRLPNDRGGQEVKKKLPKQQKAVGKNFAPKDGKPTKVQLQGGEVGARGESSNAGKEISTVTDHDDQPSSSTANKTALTVDLSSAQLSSKSITAAGKVHGGSDGLLGGRNDTYSKDVIAIHKDRDDSKVGLLNGE